MAYLYVMDISAMLEAVRTPILCSFLSRFQISMNVRRTLLAVGRCVQTLMDLLNVHAKMGFVLPVIKGTVMVSELLERCQKAD